MKLFEFNRRTTLLEGGNVTINDQSADRIDANAREQAVPIIDAALAAINSAFAQYSGRPLWHPALLANRQFLSGSAFHFFDRANIKDLAFVKAKPTVGDIDTQVDVEMKDNIIAWLKKLPPGSRLGEAVYIGLKDDPLALGGPQLITLWNFPSIQIKTKNPDGSTSVRGTNIQIDLELKEFETKPGQDFRSPTRWSQFSASSSWADLSAGVKGVFHKYLIMALSKLTEKDVIIRKPVYNRKTKEYDSYKYSEPKRVPMFTFAVGSREGGGLRPTYIPVLDASGKQEKVDNLPVYDVAGTTGYVRDVDQIFRNLFGDKLSRSDYKKVSNDFDSFSGILSVMKKYLDQDDRQRISDKFREKIIGQDEIGRRAQELYKGDAKKDRTEKLTAYNLLLKTLSTSPPAGFDQILQDYYSSYEKGKGVEESITEDDNPDYARKGIQHIYNRLPDGRVSSMEMRDREFLDLVKEIADNGGTLDSTQINLKIDGAGIRFGRDTSGNPFFMTSRVTKPLYKDDIGYFERFGKSQGQSDEQLARTRNYDRALSTIVNSDFIKQLPNDTIVQAEMLFNSMAQPAGNGQLKFVNIPYDQKHLGSNMTLVPILVREYGTGKTKPDQDKIIKKLVSRSTPEIKIISNKLEHKGIDVRKIIKPAIDMSQGLASSLLSKGTTPEKTRAKEILDNVRQQLSQAIISSPQLKGKNMLGDNMEGIVINFPSGRLVKVTSQQMKSAMASKISSQPEFGNTQTRTAVVAIGNFAGHRGHEQLINFAVDKAKELRGTPFIFVGHKVGPDDPIDIKTKLETLRRLFPGVTVSVVENQVDPATGQITVGNIFKKIEYELIKKDPFYNNIIITVGSDQASIAKTAEQMQTRYSKFAPLAHVKVSAYVTPRGADAGGTGISTTQLRNALRQLPEQDAFKIWSSAYNVSRLGPDYIKYLMAIAKQNMGIDSTVPNQTKVSADQIAKEAARKFKPKFTGYFRGRDSVPVGDSMVGESIRVGDKIRTRSMTQSGIVESVSLYRPFGEHAVYFKTADNQLLRTPLSNVIKIFGD